MAGLCLMSGTAWGGLVIDAGTHALDGGSASLQTVELWVNNTEASPIAVGSLDFYVQLGNGSGSAPAIANVNLVTGTIFAADNLGQSAFSGNTAQLQYHAVLENSTPATHPEIPVGLSKLATLSLDTWGYASGLIELKLMGTDWGDTGYLDPSVSPLAVTTTINNGWLNITPVPEPNTTAVVGGLLLGTGLMIRRLRTR